MRGYTVVAFSCIAALALLLCVVIPFTAAAQSESVELQKLEIERAKLAEEQKRTRLLDAAEERLKRTENKHWMLIAGAIGTPLTILASILIAGFSYMVQAKHKAAETDAQFKLKAAEIVMASRSADQIQAKAMALAALLPNELGTLGESFDPGQFHFGHTVERRQTLIALLAANPDVRKDTIRTWTILFPYDEWLDELLTHEGLPPRDTPPLRAQRRAI